MAEAKKDNRNTTPAFRVSFHSVFEKKEQQNGKNQYCVTMLFPKDTDLDALKKAVGAACKEKWNGKPENFQSPFKDGNAKASKYESHKDMIVVEARTDYKPQIRNAANSADIEHAEVSPDGFYNGCCRTSRRYVTMNLSRLHLMHLRTLTQLRVPVMVLLATTLAKIGCKFLGGEGIFCRLPDPPSLHGCTT